MGGARFGVAARYISSTNLRGSGMESGGRIHPSRRCANTDTDPYAFLDTYTLPDNNSYQYCHVDAYSYTNEDANSYEDSLCYRYPLV
jgi:hypothetical protein